MDEQTMKNVCNSLTAKKMVAFLMFDILTFVGYTFLVFAIAWTLGAGLK
jgi:hypothetical protein